MAEDTEDEDVAENDASEDEDDEDAPKKGKRGLILIIVAVLLLGGGAALFFTGMLDSLLGAPEATEEAEAMEEGEMAEVGEDGKKKAEETAAVYYELPGIVANLNPGSATPSFIKATLTLEAPSQEVVAKIQAVQPKIMDIINTYVRELRPSDLKGSAGVYRLRDELLLRINKALFPDKINNILFKELLIQ